MGMTFVDLQAIALQRGICDCTDITYGAGTSLQDVEVDTSEYTGPPMQFRIRYRNCHLTPNQFELHGVYGNSPQSIIFQQVDISDEFTDYFFGLKIKWGSLTGHVNYEYADFEVTRSGVVLKNFDGGELSLSANAIISEQFYLGFDPVSQNDSIMQNPKTASIGGGVYYGLKFTENGDTIINCVSSSKAVEIRQGDVRAVRVYNGGVGINTTFPSARLHITQSNGAAKPALKIDQDDIDEPILSINCTESSDSTTSVSTEKPAMTLEGYTKVEINGTEYWMPFYSKD